MRYPWMWAACLLFGAITPNIAHAGCADPDLSAQIPDFRALQTSRINALLRFGQTHNLCFGIEYVDTALLLDITDIRIPAGTIRQAIRSILENDLLAVEVHEKVVEVSRIPTTSNVEDLFDYVLPAFEARRGPVQEISNLLHMYLVTDLNPEISGFAGHYFPGDLKDEVGPFREYNRSLRYLLNSILVQSQGGAWIARVAWGLRGDVKIPERRPIWTFIEYGVPNTGYSAILANIAADLKKDNDAASGVPNQAVNHR